MNTHVSAPSSAPLPVLGVARLPQGMLRAVRLLACVCAAPPPPPLLPLRATPSCVPRQCLHFLVPEHLPPPRSGVGRIRQPAQGRGQGGKAKEGGRGGGADYY
jgi:hypothetical protein